MRRRRYGVLRLRRTHGSVHGRISLGSRRCIGAQIRLARMLLLLVVLCSVVRIGILHLDVHVVGAAVETRCCRGSHGRSGSRLAVVSLVARLRMMLRWER